MSQVTSRGISGDANDNGQEVVSLANEILPHLPLTVQLTYELEGNLRQLNEALSSKDPEIKRSARDLLEKVREKVLENIGVDSKTGAMDMAQALAPILYNLVRAIEERQGGTECDYPDPNGVAYTALVNCLKQKVEQLPNAPGALERFGGGVFFKIASVLLPPSVGGWLMNDSNPGSVLNALNYVFAPAVAQTLSGVVASPVGISAGLLALGAGISCYLTANGPLYKMVYTKVKETLKGPRH